MTEVVQSIAAQDHVRTQVAAEIAKGYDWVMFIDSDAYVSAPQLSLHDFMCSVDNFNISSGAPLWTANLILPSDCPQYKTNTGIQLWHSTPDSVHTRWMSKSWYVTQLNML